MFKEKKLYKSTDKKISGVCAGVAEYFGIDPTIARIVYALASLFTGGFGGVIIYVILALIIPQRPFPEYHYDDENNNING